MAAPPATASSAAPQAGPAYEPVSVPVQPAGGTPPPSSGYTAVPTPLPPAGGGYAPPPPPPASGYAAVPTPQLPTGGGYAPPPPPPVGYAVPGAAPGGGGGSALKIILIVVAILVGLGILGAGAVGFMVWRVAHAIHMANHGGQLTLNTPSGSVTAGNGNNLTPEELGTEVYPGAQAAKGGMRMSLPTGSIVSAVFLTSDSKDQVLSFYKDKLGSEASVFDNATSAMITRKKGSQETVMVTISTRAGEEDGKTKIAIVHTRNKGSS